MKKNLSIDHESRARKHKFYIILYAVETIPFTTVMKPEAMKNLNERKNVSCKMSKLYQKWSARNETNSNSSRSNNNLHAHKVRCMEGIKRRAKKLLTINKNLNSILSHRCHKYKLKNVAIKCSRALM